MDLDRDISQEPVIASKSQYDADKARATVMEAVSDIRNHLEALQITNKLREKQYLDDLESIRAHDRFERVVIAICGATGAGKSSLINAVVDDEIVPTSGTAACTSVVTRIQFSPTGEYRAEVHFLTREEWVKELKALIADVADSQSGHDDSEHTTGSLGEVAKVSWDKFHAVYPDIPLQELAGLQVDDLLEDYSAVTSVLDQTLPILAETSETFSVELCNYLETRKDLQGEIAYWPLIRDVDIFCPACVLQTGAVLVDLPGVADLSSARNAIAQKFMEQSHHFWIIAPVQRAVDDRTALDLLGKAWKTQLRLDGSLNPESITFIATKSDGFRVAEVVKSLGLSERPEYKKLSQRVARCAQILKDAEKAYSESSNAVTNTMDILNAKQTRVAELRSFLEITGIEGAAVPNQLKPNQIHIGQASSSTRKRKQATSAANPKDSAAKNKRARNAISQAQPATPAMPNRTDVEKEIAALDGEIVREQLASLNHYQAQNDARKTREEAEVAYAWSQKELVTYCHTARSEFLRKHIQASFRDDTADYTQSDMGKSLYRMACGTHAGIRAIAVLITATEQTYQSLPYLHEITHAIPISGEPLEFTSIEDTGIPALQRSCHALTLTVREDDTRKAMSALRAQIVPVRTFVEDAPNVAEDDRELQRAKWESVMIEGSWGDKECAKENDLLDADKTLWEQTGVVWRLIEVFDELTQECGRDLKEYFQQSLDVRCKEAAELAAERAYTTSEEFARGRTWQTYRAILRRDGQWGPAHDLNAELTIPFAVHIASSWRDLFSANLFGKLERDVMQTIDDLVDEFVQGVPEYLKARAQQQADACRQEALSALSTVMAIVACELHSEQKRISRSIAPFVQGALLQVYKDALLMTGKKSVARQTQYVHDSVHEERHDLFGDAASALMKRLETAADGLAQSLRRALQKIARKAEVNLSVLWEKAFDDDEDGEARKRLLALLDSVLANLDALEHARELRDTMAAAGPGDGDGDDNSLDEDDIASGDEDLDHPEGEDATMDEDDGQDLVQAECEAGTHDGDSVEDTAVDEETGGGLSGEPDLVADAQDKPAANSDTDVIMDVVPAHPGDKGPSAATKVEVKMEDIVEDGGQSDDSIGKEA